ncbi:MAG: hypothetical protein EOO63_15805, partial [Hymenobacter sp.]
MPASPSPTRVVFTVVAVAYIFGSAGYLAYSYVNDTGLSGWLDTWQMEHLGTAHRSLTQAGNILLWVLGLVPIFYLLVRLNRAENYTLAAQAQARVDAWSPSSRRIQAVVFALLTLGVFGFLSYRDAHLASQPVRSIDLNTGQALPPGTELASIRGVLAGNFGFLLEKKGSSLTTRTLYAPILPRTWEPGQPVHYVVKTQNLSYLDPTTNRVSMLDSGQAFMAVYDGRLSTNDLPTYVAQSYAEQQLTLATPYYVLDYQEVSYGRATLPNGYTRWLVLAIGLFISVYVLVAPKPQY